MNCFIIWPIKRRLGVFCSTPLHSSVEAGSAPSLFDEVGDAKLTPFSVPLFPNFERVVQGKIQNPSQTSRLSQDDRLLVPVKNNGRASAVVSLLPVEQAIEASISAIKSVLDVAGTPSPNCKMMNVLLAKMHRAMAHQVQLANTELSSHCISGS